MKNILYIGHRYHNKTHSNDFILELLSTKFKITYCTIDLDNNEPCGAVLQKLKVKRFDAVALWQIFPDRALLDASIEYKTGIAFPMFDSIPENIHQYSDFLFINFSKKLFNDLLHKGYFSKYIQYFPSPKNIENLGKTDAVYFWERKENFGINECVKLFKNINIKTIYWNTGNDPNSRLSDSSLISKDISIYRMTWFENISEMLNKMQECCYFVAPRESEGIGMGFLTAMAHGRCVVANDESTMNEYIRHGDTGILFNFDSPSSIDKFDVRKIQHNAYNYIKEGYQDWVKNKSKILEWIEEFINLQNNNILPKVTIVTCTFNLVKCGRAEFIRKTIQSVSQQKYNGEIEHLFIDGASKDGTVELIEELCSNHKYSYRIISEPDEGIYDAMNRGLKHASGQYICYLNSDDFFCDDYAVQHSIEKILFDNADISYANSYVIDELTEKVKAFWFGSLDLLPMGQYPNHQTLFVSIDKLREINGFDLDLKVIADNDSMCRLFANGCKFTKLNACIVKFRDGGFSNTADKELLKKVQDEKDHYGPLSFYRQYSDYLTLSECEALFAYRFLGFSKERIYEIMTKLPLKDWQKSVYLAVTKGPWGLITPFEISNKSSECIENQILFECATFGQYFLFLWKHLLLSATGKIKISRYPLLVKTRVANGLIRNTLKYKKYQILNIMFPSRKINSKFLGLRKRKVYKRLVDKQKSYM